MSKSKNVSISHLAISVTNLERSLEFYAKYCEMKEIRRRHDPVNVWLSDGVRPFQLVLLLEHPDTGAHHGNLKHPIVASTHIGFTCKSCTEVKKRAAMAKEEGILTYGPVQEGWPGGYVALINDPDGHNVELSYNQEAGYQALFDSVADLDALKNTMRDGEEKWED